MKKAGECWRPASLPRLRRKRHERAEQHAPGEDQPDGGGAAEHDLGGIARIDLLGADDLLRFEQTHGCNSREDAQDVDDVSRAIHTEVLNATLGLEDEPAVAPRQASDRRRQLQPVAEPEGEAARQLLHPF